MQFARELSPVSLETIATMAEEAKGCIDYIYLHWSAGRHGQIYDDYHISIDWDGRIYLPYNCKDLTVYREHTWHRNSNAIGIALCAGYGAVANDGWNSELGIEGASEVTSEQIEAMALVVATICKHADIPLNHVITHYEAACNDGYGVPYGTWVNGVYQCDSDCRWDLWYLPDTNCDNKMKNGGEVLRGKANWYLMTNRNI